MDSRLISYCLDALGAMPGKDVTPIMNRMYRLVVFTEDLPDDDAKWLLTEVVRRCRMRPSPAELLELLAERRGRAASPELLMNEIAEAVRIGGEYVPVVVTWQTPDGMTEREATRAWRCGMPSSMSDTARAMVAMLGGWEQVVGLYEKGTLGAAIGATCRDLKQRGIHDLPAYAREYMADAGSLLPAATIVKQIGAAQGGEDDEVP